PAAPFNLRPIRQRLRQQVFVNGAVHEDVERLTAQISARAEQNAVANGELPQQAPTGLHWSNVAREWCTSDSRCELAIRVLVSPLFATVQRKIPGHLLEQFKLGADALVVQFGAFRMMSTLQEQSEHT